MKTWRSPARVGRIWVESEGQGQESTSWFILRVRLRLSGSAGPARAVPMERVDEVARQAPGTYEEAARDPLFQADNAAVLQDFAALDAEAEQEP